jgi:hypothetical protein
VAPQIERSGTEVVRLLTEHIMTIERFRDDSEAAFLALG